jgi:serine/threonine-protein kinase
MPAPTTLSGLVDRVRRSGLIPPERLDGFLVGLQTSGRTPATIQELLGLLIDAGMITRFHADKLAAGKYRGFQLGNYLILDQLGTGGMGQVYLAEHASMRRLVGLKVLPAFASEDVVARERFFREARAAATLDHPNIVRVFDLCQEGKLHYLVMEYVEGISLQALVGRVGMLDVTAACHYARQIAFGLQHAHEVGFVHRDIKPANLLLDRSGVVKILDFGLVRSEADKAAGLTKQLDSKSILGTADYVAPEQAVDSSGVDSRADIYSLGATLYYLLAGKPLFPEGRTAQKLVWQQIKDPAPIRRLRPEVPAELAGVVHTMLQKKREDRFQSAADVFDALAPWTEEALDPPPEEWMPTAPPRVAIARSVTPPTTGAASQIVAAAMRSGGSSGVGRGATIRTPHGAAGDSSGAVITPPPLARGAGDTVGADVASQDTQRTPGPGRVAEPPEEEPPAQRPAPVAPSLPWWQRPSVIVGVLAGAAAAGAALAVLVARG